MSIIQNKKFISRFSLTILIILVAVFLISCTAGGGSANANSAQDPDYRYGNQALEMRLLNPATEDFYEGEKASILVEYFNRGTSDIVNGEFFVSGYDLNFMNFALDPKTFSIEGKDKFDPNGDFSNILKIESVSPMRLPKNTDEFTQTVKIVGCYDYKTLTTAELCIDPDPYNRRVTQKVCNMAPVSPGGQGAPLVVTNIIPKVANDDLRLDLTISNQGGGILFDKDLSNQECFFDLDKYDDLNKVDLVKVEFSNHRLDCTRSNPITLVGGSARISCECKNCLNTYADAYTTPVTIEFEYGYRNEITKQIRILKD